MPKKIDYIRDVGSPKYEEMQKLLVNLIFLARQAKSKTIAITSWNEKEGRTSTAVQLAHVMAKTANARVLLIDLDLRKPDIHNRFGLTNTNHLGITDFCLSKATPADVLHDVHYNLDVIVRGQLETLYPKTVLTNDKLKKLLIQAKNIYDFILIDTPPLKLFSDSFILARMIDTTLFVINAKSAKKRVVAKSFSTLKSAYMPVLGTVITGKKTQPDRTYRKYGR